MVIRIVLSILLLIINTNMVLASDIGNGNIKPSHILNITNSDPSIDFVTSINNNDLRFIGYYRGRTLVIPGVNDFAKLYMNKYGFKIVKDVYLYLDQNPEADINKKLWNYVKDYNVLLLNHINKK